MNSAHRTGNGVRCTISVPNRWFFVCGSAVPRPERRMAALQGNCISKKREELCEVAVFPACKFELCPRRGVGVVLAHDVEGHVAQDGKIVIADLIGTTSSSNRPTVRTHRRHGRSSARPSAFPPASSTPAIIGHTARNGHCGMMGDVKRHGIGHHVHGFRNHQFTWRIGRRKYRWPWWVSSASPTDRNQRAPHHRQP